MSAPAPTAGKQPASTNGDGSLEAHAVTVHFAGVKAVQEVDLTLGRREILGLIGPNGAGKTTLMNVLSGFLRPLSGRVVLSGLDVTGVPPFKLARLGVARTFQSVRPFAGLSVLDNVAAGAIGVKVGRREAQRRAWELLELMHLTPKARWRAESLPYGEEHLVGLARALAMHPRFLLLDEPAAGLNEVETDELVAIIAAVRDRFGCGILVIEHDMSVILRLCERVEVLDYGATISSGTVEEVQQDPRVIEAYLGSEAARIAEEARIRAGSR
jgi:branched-chain amino acid transport system ATP-binding protein